MKITFNVDGDEDFCTILYAVAKRLRLDAKVSGRFEDDDSQNAARDLRRLAKDLDHMAKWWYSVP